MPFLFANPLGFLALLGIPAVLLIHFLQRQSRRLPISTLFLLDPIDRESVKGRNFDRLRQSIPLWLQLLGVLLLTWLLVEPRWPGEKSVQRVVLVIDSSASMEAFSAETAKMLREKIPPLTESIATTEYSLIESTVTGSNLYRGTSFEELMAALEKWCPYAGTHSPEHALRVGRSLAGSEGTLLFVTDHPRGELPYGASQLSTGSPLDNVGFVGLRVEREGEKTVWQATLRNYSETPQSRRWRLGSPQQESAERSLDLAPGETRTLKGEFPEGIDRLRLVLDADRFSRDDTLYLVRPSPKPIFVSRSGSPTIEALVAALLESLENVPQAIEGTTPDLFFTTYNPLQPSESPPVAIVYLNQEQVPRRFFEGPLVASNHSLVRDLDWQGLIARSTPSIPMREGDSVLLWQGERALILLREEADRQQLIFNFDVLHANAPRLPAFVILIHRFVHRLREGKRGSESLNVDARQSLALAFDTGPGAAPISLETAKGQIVVTPEQMRHLRAPDLPGFFRVTQGSVPLLEAASNFADTREADFSNAAPFSDIDGLPAKIREQRTVADPWWQVWLLLLTALALASWFFSDRPRAEEKAAAA